MKIYCLRHGLTELNKKKVVNGQIDEPLALEGIEQAKAIVSSIPNTIKIIYSSPLQRAVKTAEIINSKLQLPLKIQEEITEIHMGFLAGKSWDQMEHGKKLKKKHRSHQFDYRQQGGELAKDVQNRVLRFLKELKSKHKDQEVLIVTHGGIIRLLYILENKHEFQGELEHTFFYTFDLDKILLPRQFGKF